MIVTTITCDLCGEQSQINQSRPTIDAPRVALMRVYADDREDVDWHPDENFDLCVVCRRTIDLILHPTKDLGMGGMVYSTTMMMTIGGVDPEYSKLLDTKARMLAISGGVIDRIDSALAEFPNQPGGNTL